MDAYEPSDVWDETEGDDDIDLKVLTFAHLLFHVTDADQFDRMCVYSRRLRAERDQDLP